MCGGRHASLDRDGAGVHEAHPRVHRAHSGDNVPVGDKAKLGTVPRLGETSLAFFFACYSSFALLRRAT